MYQVPKLSEKTTGKDGVKMRINRDESTFVTGRRDGGEQYPLNRIMAAYVRIARKQR